MNPQCCNSSSAMACSAQTQMHLSRLHHNYNCRASPRFLSDRKFVSGRPLYATVDFLAADGYRLGWIVPGIKHVSRRNIQLTQVLNEESEDNNNEKEEMQMTKLRKEEVEESNRIEEVEESCIREEELKESNVKKANLFASKSERILLPINADLAGLPRPVSSFFSRSSGRKSILNISSLQDFQLLGPDTYRCTLPKMEFLKFAVAPVVDLRVTTTCTDCVVEMLSCRLEGSKVVESQNKNFSASAKNHITWNVECEEPFVDIYVELNVILEVYTLPFSLLPVSAVERPGNIILQTLLNRIVPNFLEQLLEDYRHWVQTGSFEIEEN